jgi:hypothetical protein
MKADDDDDAGQNAVGGTWHPQLIKLIMLRRERSCVATANGRRGSAPPDSAGGDHRVRHAGQPAARGRTDQKFVYPEGEPDDSMVGADASVHLTAIAAFTWLATCGRSHVAMAGQFQYSFSSVPSVNLSHHTRHALLFHAHLRSAFDMTSSSFST